MNKRAFGQRLKQLRKEQGFTSELLAEKCYPVYRMCGGMKKEDKRRMLQRIRQRREILGYTQEKFCEMIGVSYSAYTKMENDFQNLTLDNMLKISRKLTVTIDYLIHGEDANDTHNTEGLVRLLQSADNDKLQYTCDFLNQLMSWDSSQEIVSSMEGKAMSRGIAFADGAYLLLQLGRRDVITETDERPG